MVEYCSACQYVRLDNVYMYITCVLWGRLLFSIKQSFLLSLSRVYECHYICLNDIIIVNCKLENDNVPLLKKNHYVGRPISHRRSRSEYNIILLLRCNINRSS